MFRAAIAFTNAADVSGDGGTGAGNGRMERDPWLDSLRKKPAFTKLLRSAEAEHWRALDAFERSNGASVLAMQR